jgi:hypothetical protein
MNRTKSISESTDIIPAMLAETIVSQYKIDNKQESASYLVERAESHFKGNSQFRKGVKQKENKGRDYLESFMRHWLAGYLFPSAPKGEAPYDLSASSK